MMVSTDHETGNLKNGKVQVTVLRGSEAINCIVLNHKRNISNQIPIVLSYPDSSDLVHPKRFGPPNLKLSFGRPDSFFFICYMLPLKN